MDEPTKTTGGRLEFTEEDHQTFLELMTPRLKAANTV
jgi:hypothetical protein